MQTRSAKAKGRRACKVFVDALLASYTELSEEDLYITPSSSNGVDIVLSAKAKAVIGCDLAPEVKNQEKLSIWKALEQATRLAKGNQVPVLVFTRNRSEFHVAFKLKDFIEILRRDDGRLRNKMKCAQLCDALLPGKSSIDRSHGGDDGRLCNKSA